MKKSKKALTHILGVLLISFLCFLFSGSVGAQDSLSILCEVMEAKKAESSSSEPVKQIYYLLIHHKDPKDREALSYCLKRKTDHEVTFSYQNEKYRGILFRLDHCFGRGLLIYFQDIKLKRGDKILLECPSS
jgi:hypothetical protein